MSKPMTNGASVARSPDVASVISLLHARQFELVASDGQSQTARRDGHDFTVQMYPEFVRLLPNLISGARMQIIPRRRAANE